jgi:hypothetical protein
LVAIGSLQLGQRASIASFRLAPRGLDVAQRWCGEVFGAESATDKMTLVVDVHFSEISRIVEHFNVFTDKRPPAWALRIGDQEGECRHAILCVTWVCFGMQI